MEERLHYSKSRRSAVRPTSRRRVVWKIGIEILLYFSSVDRNLYHLHSFTISRNDVENFILFIAQSFLTLGVSVGGIHEFEDQVVSNGYVKPWRNVEARVNIIGYLYIITFLKI